MLRPSILALGFSSLILGSASALAESPPTGVIFGGFFDAYYSFNSNDPRQVTGLDAASVSGASIAPANNTYRYYDMYHNQATLSLAELSVKATRGEVTLLAEFVFGSFADANATVASTSGALVDESSKHLGQALVSYKASGSRWSFDLGKAYSHLGVETVKSKDNFNYSRSVLFSYAIPFWTTGVRVGYDVVPDELQVSLYLSNGWNTSYDVNRAKTSGLQLKYVPSAATTIIYNVISGAERTDSESDLKTVHEINATIAVDPDMQVIFDSVHGSEQNALVGGSRIFASWYGALVGLRSKIDDESYWSPRVEVYRDENGVSLGGPAQTLKSLTVTYGRRLSDGFETRFEVRGEESDQSVFTDRNGPTKKQATALAAALFHF